MKESTTKMDKTKALLRKSTVIYDGQCSFCRQSVSRIARLDRNDKFEFIARQTKGLDLRFPKLAEGDFNTGMRLITPDRSEEHTSELQSRRNLVCRLLLEKKNNTKKNTNTHTHDKAHRHR